MRAIPGFLEMELLIKRGFLQIRKHQHAPTIERPPILRLNNGRRKAAERSLVVVQGNDNLFQVILRNDPVRPCANPSDGRQEEKAQTDAADRDGHPPSGQAFAGEPARVPLDLPPGQYPKDQGQDKKDGNSDEKAVGVAEECQET